MVTASIENIFNYSPNKNDVLFFDTNVWLDILGPSPKHWAQKPCSYIYREALKNKVDICTNCMVISEFINAWSRLEFNQQRRKLGLKSNQFKVFRNDSSIFNPISQEISLNVEKILGKTVLSDSYLANIDMSKMIQEYKSGNSDFNDLILQDVCKTNNYILVTNDGDFCCSDVDILTANKRLLKSN